MNCRSDALYDPFEIKRMMERAVLLVDTREQDTGAYRRRMEQIGLPHERVKLDAGDYGIRTTDDAGRVLTARTLIERKQSADELCSCFTSERGRFRREFERAVQAGVKMWLLVEETSWVQLLHGQYRSRMHPNALMGSVFSWAARYGIRIVLCRQEDAPTLIRSILWYALERELEEMTADGEQGGTKDGEGGAEPASDVDGRISVL